MKRSFKLALLLLTSSIATATATPVSAWDAMVKKVVKQQLLQPVAIEREIKPRMFSRMALPQELKPLDLSMHETIVGKPADGRIPFSVMKVSGIGDSAQREVAHIGYFTLKTKELCSVEMKTGQLKCRPAKMK